MKTKPSSIAPQEETPDLTSQPVPATAGGWLMFAIGKWGIGGACLALAAGALYFVYGDLRETTRQMVQDQKEQNIANLRVVVENTEAITRTGEAISEVGEAVE